MRTPLDGTRLVACLVSSCVVGAHLWLLRSHPASIAALILLLALVVVTYRRGRPVPGEPLLVPVLLVIVGIGWPTRPASSTSPSRSTPPRRCTARRGRGRSVPSWAWPCCPAASRSRRPASPGTR